MKRLLKILASPILIIVCLVISGISMAIATFIEAIHSTAIAWQMVYNAKWFELLLVVSSVNLIASVIYRKLFKWDKLSIFVFHLAFVVIILGAAITRYSSYEGTLQLMEGEQTNQIVLASGAKHQLPFKLKLLNFQIEYYPGSNNPQGFVSQVYVRDIEKGEEFEHNIFMNNILSYRGYRFYQSSYTKNMEGTILSVSKDGLGTFITYLGYFLLAVGMLVSLLNPHSRFRKILVNKPLVLVLLLYLTGSIGKAQGNIDSVPIIPLEHANSFGEILVRDYQGRTKPMYTLMNDLLRKLYKKRSFQGQDPSQVFLGILVYPDKWDDIDLIYAGPIAQGVLSIPGEYTSLYSTYQGNGRFISSDKVFPIYRKSAQTRSKEDKSILKFDERLNIMYHWIMGNMLTIYPIKNDSIGKWYSPYDATLNVETEDSLIVKSLFPVYLNEVKQAMRSGHWETANELLEGIKQYQRRVGKDIPSEHKVALELWYGKSKIFKKTAFLYLFFGLLLLVLSLGRMLRGKKGGELVMQFISAAILGTFLIHTTGLAVRWYIAGHAPWTNTYETMIFIAWSAALAGVCFIKKNKAAFAIAVLLAVIFLLVASMSWMDPQITNLVPVLRSIWLIIHVAVITSSYGFFGIGALMALTNLVLMGIQSNNNTQVVQVFVKGLSRIIEVSLIVGLYLLTIGTFLGAIWANVSWGRYWGWDPKETWALITILVYSVVLHLRLVPRFDKVLVANVLSLLSFASVLMTYFGVNFYLSGLHSYAKGDPPPIPNGIYLAGLIITFVIALAIYKEKKMPKFTGI